MSSIIEKYSRALKLYRDDGISVPVLPSEMRTLIADFLALKEHCAALESREVCTVAHENVGTCGYCQRDALSKDAERYRMARSDPYGVACLERNPNTGNRVILFGKEADAVLDNLAERIRTGFYAAMGEKP